MGNRMSSDAPTKSSPSVIPSISSPFTHILPSSTHSVDVADLYTLGPELGRGQSGIIRSCTSLSSGALFACKSISKLHLHTTADVDHLLREIRIMTHLSQPLPSQPFRTLSTNNHIPPHTHLPLSIVRLHDVVEDKAFVHLIMELCNGGELFDRIVKKKCYPEAQAASLMKSLLETVQFCHSMGIMHRDIKPENILLVEDSDTSSIKLADFGLALEFSPGQKFSGMAGSTYYIAPEVLKGEYSEEIDMWSAGVILYILLSGVPPFWGSTEQRIFKAIRKGDLNFPHDTWDNISLSAKDMIAQMLHPDAKLRLTPAQALEHPWIVHHTKNSEHVQCKPTSDTLPLTATCPDHKCAGDSGLHTSTFTVSSHKQTGMSNAAKPEIHKLFVDLVAGADRNTFSISDCLARKSGCTVLSLNGNGETFVVDMGQEKYLVLHDRTRKKIGWRLLKEKPTASSVSLLASFSEPAGNV